MPFPPNVLKDLNVVDLPLLTSNVKSFVETNRIKPSDLVVVMDEEIYFEKVLGETTLDATAQQVQDFIDSVPLSNPSSKVFKIDNKYHAVVINRHLFESVRQAFESLGFRVVAVVPELIVGQMGAGKEFDANACRLVLRRLDFIKENSFVGTQHDFSSDNLVNKNKGLAVGLSVGSILIMVAVIGIFSWQVTQTKQAAIARLKARAAESAKTLPKPTPVPTILITPTSAAPNLSNLTFEIRNASGVVGEASRAAQLLGTLRVTNIVETNSPASASSTVIYSPEVNSQARLVVTTAVKTLRPDAQEQTGTSSLPNVVIILGKIAP